MKINEEISSARSASADHLKPEITESLMRLSTLSNQEEEIKTRIDQVLATAGTNKKEISELECVKDWHWWTVGAKVVDNKKNFDQLKDVLAKVAENVTDVVSAQRDAECIIAKILKFQHDIGEEMNNLVGAWGRQHTCLPVR